MLRHRSVRLYPEQVGASKSQDISWKSWVQSRFRTTVPNEHKTRKLDLISNTDHRFKLSVSTGLYVPERAIEVAMFPTTSRATDSAPTRLEVRHNRKTDYLCEFTTDGWDYLGGKVENNRLYLADFMLGRVRSACFLLKQQSSCAKFRSAAASPLSLSFLLLWKSTYWKCGATNSL